VLDASCMQSYLPMNSVKVVSIGPGVSDVLTA